MNKTFNWEGYNSNGKEHKFSDFSNEELKNWSVFWGFDIQNGKEDIFVYGRKNKIRIKVT